MLDHLKAESGLISAGDVASIRPMGVADRLDSLARKPLTPGRNELLMLAQRLRALDALDHAHDQQLILAEVV